MSREEFLKQLESRLQDISQDEREEALKFYTSYFEEAGEEKEDEILKELKSPEDVANSIKQNLESEEKEHFSEKEYFSENGFKDENSFEQQQPPTHTPIIEKKSGTNIALLILLCIFAIPVGLPLLISVFAVFISFFAVGLSLFLGFGFAGVICVIVGVVLFFTGITQVPTIPFISLALIAGGLITFGIGVLLGLLAFLSFQLIPLMIKGCIAICRIPFKNRRAMA